MRVYTKDVEREAARKASVRSAVEVYQEIGLSLSEVIRRIASKFQLTDEDAEEKVCECWK